MCLAGEPCYLSECQLIMVYRNLVDVVHQYMCDCKFHMESNKYFSVVMGQ